MRLSVFGIPVVIPLLLFLLNSSVHDQGDPQHLVQSAPLSQWRIPLPVEEHCTKHRYEITASNIDDVVKFYLDGVLIAETHWGVRGHKPFGTLTRIGHRPGELGGRFDITPFLGEKPTAMLRVVSINRRVCCAWRMAAAVLKDGKPMWAESFAVRNSRKQEHAWQVELTKQTCEPVMPQVPDAPILVPSDTPVGQRQGMPHGRHPSS